jgi:hypothetical protein
MIINSKLISIPLTKDASISDLIKQSGQYGNVLGYQVVDDILILKLAKPIKQAIASPQMPVGGGPTVGQTYIDPATKTPYKVEDVIQTPEGQSIVQIDSTASPSGSAYVPADEFQQTVQPVQGLNTTNI